MIDTIVYRHKLGRKPTMNDVDEEIGLDEFIEQLKEEGWIDANCKTVVKAFSVTHGYDVHNENCDYIEWKGEIVKLD